MSGTDPGNNLTPDEIENRERLEAVVQRGLRTYAGVSNALAEIRDRQLYRATNATFEAYLHQRWGLDSRGGSQPDVLGGVSATSSGQRHQPSLVRSKRCEDLAKVCEQTLSALGGDVPVDVEIRLAVRKQQGSNEVVDRSRLHPVPLEKLVDDELVPRLRWLLTQASGTIGDVVHQLESRAADIDNGARAELRDDVLVLDEELAALQALLGGPVDWDSKFGRLLKGEIPPLENDGESYAGDDE